MEYLRKRFTSMKTDSKNQKKSASSDVTSRASRRIVSRPPVVVVMGHVDHGKTKLLDYIRKTNVVEQESGGITQHIGAYEVFHDGRKITFIDTPGHEAFSALRTRGAHVADIAILVVAADEGVKPQTLEALDAIKKAGLPYLVALNKVDKPDINSARVKNQLAEAEVFVEGAGGSVPIIEVSAKTGQGIDDLLETLLLLADLEELKGDPAAAASGVVIESDVDPRRGIAATLLITNGTLRKNEVVVADGALAQVRIFENFLGKNIEEAGLSAPVRVVGFETLPAVGRTFRTFTDRQEALAYIPTLDLKKDAGKKLKEEVVEQAKIKIAIVIKADVMGSVEALVGQLDRLKKPLVQLDILKADVGNVSEDDVQLLAGGVSKVIVAFRVGFAPGVEDAARQLNVTLLESDIIYKVEDDFRAFIQKAAINIQEEVEIGSAKILKIFSKSKGQMLVGARVLSGALKKGAIVTILRDELEMGKGVIRSLKIVKADVESVRKDQEFGTMIKTDVQLQGGDMLRASAVRPLEL